MREMRTVVKVINKYNFFFLFCFCNELYLADTSHSSVDDLQIKGEKDHYYPFT